MGLPASLNRGPIAWMANNPVAANLLMAVLLFGGVVGLFSTKQEIFPEFDLDVISISVPYPGASPTESEQAIVLAVEEAVRGIEGVKHVNSSAAENAGVVSIELLLSADPDKVLADVKSAVDRIQSFPEDAEEPEVKLLTRTRSVVSLLIAGDQDLSTLYAVTERARAALLAHPDITQVEVSGLPPLEVGIEVPRETLESYGMTLDGIAMQVRAASLELPGGSVDTRGGEILVKVADRKRTAQEFEDLVLRGTAGGGQVRLGDIARVKDGFQDLDLAAAYNGHTAARITVYRVGDETPRSVARAVHQVRDELVSELPANVTIDVWDDDSQMLDQRIDLLLRNAWLGGILVVGVLAVFLDLRLAFWVALGIPVSFLGALFLMPRMDISINMVTLFAFIITLGMVVDDAIVVGENAHHHMQNGMNRLEAAVRGAREMAMPVTFSILTTAAAFAPLYLVPGVMGKIFGLIPVIVIAVLGISLAESFFILPAHLAHRGGKTSERRGVGYVFGRALDLVLGPAERVQKRISAALERFIEHGYVPFVRVVLRHRMVVMALATAAFILAVGAVVSGVVPFQFFPSLEGDNVVAEARLPYGTPVERTREVQKILEASARKAIEESGGDDFVIGTYTTLGLGRQSGSHSSGSADSGSHVLAIEVSLVPLEQRSFSGQQFAARWKAATPDIPGLEAMTISSASGPGAGAAVDVQLSHVDTRVLAAASTEMADILREYPDLTDVKNSWSGGKQQLDFHLLPQATTLGLTSQDVARQLRSAFYGAEALREQRGRSEVRVMVRLPEEQRRSENDLAQLQVRTPAGAFVPLSYVAEFERGRAPTVISREDGRRKVNVEAELAAGVKSNRAVLESLKGEVLPEFMTRYPGLEWSFTGSQRAQAESFASLRVNFLLALFAIYALLAVPFRSYTQPGVVMAAIPFGFVGAIFGHLVMGYELSMISIMGLVAMAGVVVNDSLVLLDAANGFRRQGMSAMEAIIAGGARRFRPILLTSLTTFFGLMPMIFETSRQARFLIPMALSLGFGILFSTPLILIVVPALYMQLETVRRLLGFEPRAGEDVSPDEAAAAR